MGSENSVTKALGVLFDKCQKRAFVHNSVCSQFLEGLFAILAECSQFCFKSINLLVGRGGLRGAKIVNKHFVNKLAFPKVVVIFRLSISF